MVLEPYSLLIGPSVISSAMLRKLLICLLCPCSSLTLAQPVQHWSVSSLSNIKISSGATFSPTNIPGHPALAYYLADYVALGQNSGLPASYNRVTNIYDLSGNGHDLTLFTSGSGTAPYPSNNWWNGHSIVHFNGVNDLLKNRDLSLPSGDCEIWMVFTFLTSAPNRAAVIHLGDVSYTQYKLIWQLEDSRAQTMTTEGGAVSLAGGYPWNGTRKDCMFLWNNSGGSIFRTNNVNNLTGFSVNTTSNIWLSIGGSQDEGYFSSIDFAMLVIYSGSLNDTIRSNMHNWCSTNWNFSP